VSSGGKVNSNFDMDMGPVDVDMEGELKYLQYSFFSSKSTFFFSFREPVYYFSVKL